MDVLKIERGLSTFIAWVTISTGAMQMIIPMHLLPLLGVESSSVTAHLFATIGMFMVLFGAAVLHALRRQEALAVLLLWSGWQKTAAAILVSWGVMNAVFSPVTLLVAVFDFISGLLFFDLRRRGK